MNVLRSIERFDEILKEQNPNFKVVINNAGVDRAGLFSKEGRETLKMFDGIENIDNELLSGCQNDYRGELAFFVISEQCRGKGIGRKLFDSVVEYMKSQGISQFYLFTDTSCNHRFYEHLGLIRRGEKKQVIDLKDEKEEMIFFIYDWLRCQN